MKNRTMKVKVTKVMAKLLNEKFPKYSFSVEEHTTGWWSDPDDYNPRTGNTKMLVVHYPASYYALPKSFTTSDLVSCFKHSDHTLEGFLKQIWSMVEI